MAIPVKATITIGKDKDKELADYRTIVIEQELFNHHTFKVVVPYDKALETGHQTGLLNQKYTAYCGEPITILLTPKQPDERKYPPLEFLGIITNVTLTNVSDFDYSYVLSGYSPTYLLEDAPQRRTFVGKKLKEIFTEVLHPYAANLLPRDLGPLEKNYNEAIDYAVQYDESPYVFLRRLADEYGKWFYYDGQQLCLDLLTEDEPEVFAVASGQQFDLSVDLKPSKFQLGHRNYLAYQQKPLAPISYGSQSRDQRLPSPLSQFTALALTRSASLFAQPAKLLASRPVYTQEQLDAAAQRRRESQANRLVTFKGKGENPGFGVDRKMTVEGYGRGKDQPPHDYDLYILTKVTHSVKDEGMYSNEFEALPHQVQHPPTNPLVQLPQGVPELARVIDVDDKERLGRIRVRYSWIAAELAASTAWVRVSTPYAGKGRGQLFTPEVGSEVLVGYEQGRPEFPVVLGNLFYRQNEQGVKNYTYPKNQYKGIETAAGNFIVFDDTEQGEEIIISNRNEGKDKTMLRISFADNGAILLTTTGKMRLEADEEIVLHSKKIRLSTEQGGRIELDVTDGGEIDLNACKVDITSEYVDVNATDRFRVDTQTELILKSKGTAELSGRALNTLKGKPVKIN